MAFVQECLRAAGDEGLSAMVGYALRVCQVSFTNSRTCVIMVLEQKAQPDFPYAVDCTVVFHFGIAYVEPLEVFWCKASEVFQCKASKVFRYISAAHNPGQVNKGEFQPKTRSGKML